ncbi:hypothetical protein JXB31_02980 [Candidatus Woesearchaeota archaeon]|nr:hypothetical protein [Candidatus Woesearchaeota archaeon]
MRRKRKEKKKSLLNKQNIVGLIIVVIMISSVLGFMINENSGNQSTDYNDHEFTQQNGYWYTSYNSNSIRLRFHPDALDSIFLSYESSAAIRDSMMTYLTFDPDDKNIEYIEQVRLELEQEMPKLFNTYIMTGVTNTDGSYGALPMISCSNATASVPVIYLASSDEDSFSYNSNCLIVSATTGNNILMMKDRLVLGLADIIS